jgi:hypothetical protein
MSLLSVHGIRILQVLIASTVVLTLFFTLGSRDSSIADHVKTSLPESLGGGGGGAQAHSRPFGGRTPEPKPANDTLDFQEILYLSMPYRTDRQDQMSLISAVTGLKLKMIPGVCAIIVVAVCE